MTPVQLPTTEAKPVLTPDAGLTPDNAAASQDQVRRFEIWISTLLRAGVVLCLVLLGVGTVLTFAHHPNYGQDAQSLHHLTTPGAAFPRSAHDLKTALLAGRGQGFTTLGLLVLIATPILRVAVSVIAFWMERDKTFVLITFTVLSLLIASLFLGRASG